MTSFNSINKRLALVNTMCQFFVRFVELLIICFITFFAYNFIINIRYSVEIDDNLNTTIINPDIITLGGTNYHIVSDKGTFVENGHYNFDNVKIFNDNINIFTNELDFYSNTNEIILRNRPIIIFNSNNTD